MPSNYPQNGSAHPNPRGPSNGGWWSQGARTLTACVPSACDVIDSLGVWLTQISPRYPRESRFFSFALPRYHMYTRSRILLSVYINGSRRETPFRESFREAGPPCHVAVGPSNRRLDKEAFCTATLRVRELSSRLQLPSKASRLMNFFGNYSAMFEWNSIEFYRTLQIVRLYLRTLWEIEWEKHLVFIFVVLINMYIAPN